MALIAPPNIPRSLAAPTSNNISASNQQPNLNIVQQWVSNVLAFSSQYNNTTWAANKVIGPPVVYPNYGDLQNTWAQAAVFSNNEFIELEYPTKVYVTRLNVYETYHGGAIIKVKVKDLNRGEWLTVWESHTGAYDHGASRIFSPELARTTFKTNQVRLELDCSVANSYCEIDAVEMVGKKYNVDPIDCERVLSLDMRRLLESNEFSDIEFEVTGRVLKAHRCILTSRSTYFRNLLMDNLKPDRLSKPVHIDKISYEAFACLLYYLYTDLIKENTECRIACELMRYADWYDLEALKEKAYAHLSLIVNQDNVIGLYLCATQEEPELDKVSDMCLRFIAKHFHVIMTRKEFTQLPQPIMMKISQYFAQFCKKQ